MTQNGSSKCHGMQLPMPQQDTTQSPMPRHDTCQCHGTKNLWHEEKCCGTTNNAAVQRVTKQNTVTQPWHKVQCRSMNINAMAWKNGKRVVALAMPSHCCTCWLLHAMGAKEWPWQWCHSNRKTNTQSTWWQHAAMAMQLMATPDIALLLPCGIAPQQHHHHATGWFVAPFSFDAASKSHHNRTLPPALQVDCFYCFSFFWCGVKGDFRCIARLTMPNGHVASKCHHQRTTIAASWFFLFLLTKCYSQMPWHNTQTPHSTKKNTVALRKVLRLKEKCRNSKKNTAAWRKMQPPSHGTQSPMPRHDAQCSHQCHSMTQHCSMEIKLMTSWRKTLWHGNVQYSRTKSGKEKHCRPTLVQSTMPWNKE